MILQKEDLLSIKDASEWANSKERLYLMNFKFICGEYEQGFNKVFYARNINNLEKKVRDYLSSYYGAATLIDIDNDIYYYWNSEVAVKFVGYSEIKNFEDLVSRLLS